ARQGRRPVNQPESRDPAEVKGALRALARLEQAGELEKPAPEGDEAEHPALAAFRSLQRLDTGEAERLALRWLARPGLDHKLHCALLTSLGDAHSDAALEVLLEHLGRPNTTFDEPRDGPTTAAEWNRVPAL